MTILSEDLVPNVKRVVEDIISSANFTSPPKVDIGPGSEIGDGFASKTLAISIKGSDKTIDLFVKYFPERTMNAMVEVFGLAFSTEFRFYDKIFPEMSKFQDEKGLTREEKFNNVPKHFKTGIQFDGIPPIILENLKTTGYTLRDCKTPIDENHLTLTLKAYAKYHAISFAMKDQKPDLFKRFSVDIKDFYVAGFNVMGLAESLGKLMNKFVEDLDPIEDKKLKNECRSMREDLINHACNVNKQVDDYAVICQGDCWSNNMMFLYDETGKPIDVKLIDWQIQRFNSPVLDVAYFFYAVATEEILANFDKYFKLYYDTLAEFLKKLGSDPKKMYPKVVFSNHWKKFAKFGLTMAFGALVVQYMKKEDLPDLVNDGDAKMPEEIKCNEGSGYQKRMKTLVKHFVDRDFL